MDIDTNAAPSGQFDITEVDAFTTQVIKNAETLFDASLILIDEDGGFKYYNSGVIDLLELDIDQISTQPDIFKVLTHLAERGDFGPGDPSQFVKLASSFFTPDAVNPKDYFQTYLTMPSGNIIRIQLCRNTDNTITLTAHDISDQRRDKNMLEMALNIGLAGYWIFDTDRVSCRVESRYLSNLLTAREMLTLQKQGPSTLWHSDDLEASQMMWDRVYESGETQNGTLRILTHNEGIRWLRIVLMPETNAPKSNRIIAFFNDITEDLRQQEKLTQAKQVAEDSLTSRENFLDRMSHEIRTPMNAVIGMSDALIHHHNDPEITPRLQLIQKSATSILKLLDETLTHSRLDTDGVSLNPAAASPAELVRDVCALWEQQALKNNNVIRVTIKDDVPANIYFDKFRYEQCVNNLLSNAVKFTHNGQIEVILAVVTKQANAPYLALAVKDTGIGMTDEQRGRIFKAYTQADDSISGRFGGTGLGLSITKQICELMQGNLSVRSELGVGTMFVMSTPITDVQTSVDGAPSSNALTEDDDDGNAQDTVSDKTVLAEDTQTETMSKQDAVVILPPETTAGLVEDMLEGAQAEATKYSNLKILVVDDNPTNHLVVKSLLDSVVGEIVLASNGEEALEVLNVQPVDIVLMDIHMPIMDGIECTLAIRSSDADWRDVLIIALTADPQYQQKKLCKNIGMDEALAKPIRLNDVIDALDTVLASREISADAAA